MQPHNRIKSVVLSILLGYGASWAQDRDSVDVTFRFKPPTFTTVYLTGEFNGWRPDTLPMSYQGIEWTLTYRLSLGGNPNPPQNGVPGAWQYKFYYKDASPWPNDSLDHHVNSRDNDNSFIYTKDPTIYQLLPNQRNPIVKTRTPTITAYLFPKLGATVDTSTLSLKIDTITVTGIGSSYNVVTKQLSYQVQSPLPNGNHTVILTARTTAGGFNADTVKFITQGGFVQISTQGGYPTRNPVRLLRGSVQDTSIRNVKLLRNSVDTIQAAVTGGVFTTNVTLVEGVNTFRAVVDTGSSAVVSDPMTITYIVNHSPFGRATASLSGNSVTLTAAASTDPDGQTLTNFKWLDDPTNPLSLSGRTGVSVVIPKPAAKGEYYFGLIVTDPDGNADTLRSYFIIRKDGSLENPTIASNPEWAKRARVYFLFPRAASSTQDFKGSRARLQYIRDMGFNVVWLMPVMKNAFPINLNFGPGYNIIDFYSIAPEYGTSEEFKEFVDYAHSLGLKIILDITPNHSSRFHPWSVDAHTFKEDSRFWNWYEHTLIPHNTNGLGQSLNSDGFSYYSGFSDQLLNINWKEIDARTEMINVLKYWVKNFGVDGYRFDVYWGPHRRYGEQYMGMPVREALKHIKPDILLLAEDDGTGPGTEIIYADYSSSGINGGVDAAYDFKLYFNQIRNFSFTTQAVNNLHSDVFNGGFYPGPNSLYMRFMESQDEDRIYYAVPFGSGPSTYFDADVTTAFRKSMPMATVVFTAPGFPMLWNGQEVGWGYGISGAKEARNRSVINWSFQGREILTPHYQRIASIRGQFPAFSSQAINRVSTSNGQVYAFTRPFAGEDGIVAVNFSAATVQATLSIPSSVLATSVQDGTSYRLSNLYADTSSTLQFSRGAVTLDVSLPPYGSAVFVLSDSVKRVNLPILTGVERKETALSSPRSFALLQNYPNPFNPQTTFRYELPFDGFVTLKVYNILGEEIITLVNDEVRTGVYSISWDGKTHNGQTASSGIYFARLVSGGNSVTRKIILLR